MNGFYFHPRWVFERYVSRPAYLAVAGVLLYNARFTSIVAEGVQLSPGQLLIKKTDIADTCGITLSQVRSALDCFVRDGGITVQSHGKRGVLITLLPPFRAEYERKNNYKKPQARENTPDPGASYDLMRAEQRARQTVPKLRKRE